MYVVEHPLRDLVLREDPLKVYFVKSVFRV